VASVLAVALRNSSDVWVVKLVLLLTVTYITIRAVPTGGLYHRQYTELFGAIVRRAKYTVIRSKAAWEL
jgi:hypothetical protein